MGIYVRMSYVGCYTWYGTEITDVLHILSGSLAIEDGKRIYNLDYRTEVLPQLLPAPEQVLAGALTRSLFKIVWNNLLLDKCTHQRDSHVPKGPVSEGKTGKCDIESNPKDLGTPFPVWQVIILYVKYEPILDSGSKFRPGLSGRLIEVRCEGKE
jgi:hypothetical protein